MGDKHRGDRQGVADSKYRPLKKSLKKTYKDMVKQVEKGNLPNGAVVAEFMALSRAMVSYPGFGDSHYDDFTIACDSLQKAFSGKDLNLFSQVLKNISKIKKECHHRYK